MPITPGYISRFEEESASARPDHAAPTVLRADMIDGDRAPLLTSVDAPAEAVAATFEHPTLASWLRVRQAVDPEPSEDGRGASARTSLLPLADLRRGVPGWPI